MQRFPPLHSYLLDNFPILQTLARNALSGDSREEGEYPEERHPESDVYGFGRTFHLSNSSIIERTALSSARRILRHRNLHIDEGIPRHHEHYPETDLDDSDILPFRKTDSCRPHKERHQREDEESVDDPGFVLLQCIRKMERDIVEIKSEKYRHDDPEKHPSEENSAIFWAFLKEFDKFEHRIWWDRN